MSKKIRRTSRSFELCDPTEVNFELKWQIPEEVLLFLVNSFICVSEPGMACQMPINLPRNNRRRTNFKKTDQQYSANVVTCKTYYLDDESSAP